LWPLIQQLRKRSVARQGNSALFLPVTSWDQLVVRQDLQRQTVVIDRMIFKVVEAVEEEEVVEDGIVEAEDIAKIEEDAEEEAEGPTEEEDATTIMAEDAVAIREEISPTHPKSAALTTR
jgi:hypothetical protein